MSKYKVTMHALNELSHALALLESENASLRGAADGLCDENAELLEQLKYERQTSRSRLESIDLLKAENAKLRELAVLNWEWAHSCCGNNCKMQTDGCGYQIDRECNYEREIYDRMRELGVEVDA